MNGITTALSVAFAVFIMLLIGEPIVRGFMRLFWVVCHCGRGNEPCLYVIW